MEYGLVSLDGVSSPGMAVRGEAGRGNLLLRFANVPDTLTFNRGMSCPARQVLADKTCFHGNAVVSSLRIAMKIFPIY